MNTEQFIKMVYAMRFQQKAYFRTRSIEHLQKSKVLENNVDEAVDVYLKNGCWPHDLFD